MRTPKYLTNVIIGATAVVGAAGYFAPTHESAQVSASSVTYLAAKVAEAAPAPLPKDGAPSSTVSMVNAAIAALAGTVKTSSHPQALASAFRSYFEYKSAHPGEVRKPYLYFVDYGLPSTAKRGYVFDMEKLQVVEGPFTVAHGRGSSVSRYGIPTRFSNNSGAATTSLGLFLAQETYGFVGHAGGRVYRSVGMRLAGLSGDWNDRARARGVVAHGAPYVTASAAGRSEGCPAMEQDRAQRLLPKLANGGLVFLFAPNQQWMQHDPWLAGSDSGTSGNS